MELSGAPAALPTRFQPIPPETVFHGCGNGKQATQTNCPDQFKPKQVSYKCVHFFSLLCVVSCLFALNNLAPSRSIPLNKNPPDWILTSRFPLKVAAFQHRWPINVWWNSFDQIAVQFIVCRGRESKGVCRTSGRFHWFYPTAFPWSPLRTLYGLCGAFHHVFSNIWCV